VGLDIFQVRDVQAIVLAGMVQAVRGAQHQGGNSLFLAGALMNAEYTCLATKVSWPEVLDEARELLGVDNRKLLDAALQLGTGADIVDTRRCK
jgi:hypothetical protein